MKQELDKKLVKKFPLLYSDRYGDKQQTLMCWGFGCGEGWFDLIYELSAKVEKEIENYIRENPNICVCGCSRKDHGIEFDDIPLTGPCNTVHAIPYSLGSLCSSHVTPNRNHCKSNRQYLKKQVVYTKWKVKRHVLRKINKVLNMLFDYGLKQKIPCSCPNFRVAHPRATQVKEKFGGLKFYMTPSPNKIFDLIEEAEAASFTICETCGEPGELDTSRYWVSTKCPKHINQTLR
jgi:hypothetical protein